MKLKKTISIITALLIIHPELVLVIYLIVSIFFCAYITCTDKKVGYYISEKIQKGFMKFALKIMIGFLVEGLIGQDVMKVFDFVIWLYYIGVCFKHQ